MRKLLIPVLALAALFGAQAASAHGDWCEYHHGYYYCHHHRHFHHPGYYRHHHHYYDYR